MTSKDYRDVEILHDSIVYCDIPYKNTGHYSNEIEFNHDEFYEWAATRKFPVYISEYDIPDNRFKLIYGIEKRVIMSANQDTYNSKTEKLYWNQI